MSILPPYQLDAGQLLDEAEATGCPIAIEAARRYFAAEPSEGVAELLEERDIPLDELGEWLDDAIERRQAFVTDRDHLRALLELVETEGPEAAAAYIRETVRDWLP